MSIFHAFQSPLLTPPNVLSLFGDSLLVAPVIHPSKSNYYIPEGKWTCFWTGEVVKGPKWVHHDNYPLDTIPVFVRPETVLLMGPRNIDIPDYDYSNVELECRHYQVTREVSAKVPVGKGAEWAGEIFVQPDGTLRSVGHKFKLISIPG